MPPTEGGLFASVKRMLQTLRHLVEDRLELFLLELKEERMRAFDALLLVVICSICTAMALMVATFTVIIVFWDEHRVLVSVLFSLIYTAGAIGTYCALRRRVRRWQPFSATLDQVKKDRECLETKN